MNKKLSVENGGLAKLSIVEGKKNKRNGSKPTNPKHQHNLEYYKQFLLNVWSIYASHPNKQDLIDTIVYSDTLKVCYPSDTLRVAFCKAFCIRLKSGFLISPLYTNCDLNSESQLTTLAVILQKEMALKTLQYDLNAANKRVIDLTRV